MTTCPRCHEPLAAGQEYCLECGAHLVRARRTKALESGWVRRALVTGLVALAGGAAAIAATGSDGGGPTIVTAVGGFANAPRTAGEEVVGPSGVAEWPAGEDGWTIALASLPQAEGRTAALARARAARKKGLESVGILDSSRYASLHPGYWIVFSGIYASEAEATSVLEKARRYAAAASVRHVVP